VTFHFVLNLMHDGAIVKTRWYNDTVKDDAMVEEKTLWHTKMVKSRRHDGKMQDYSFSLF
jgi:hypothetical protein